MRSGRRGQFERSAPFATVLTKVTQVGYSVRFEALCTADTKVLYLTDGMLFREILLDPLLSR
jgi:HrpA-like RNA helicase